LNTTEVAAELDTTPRTLRIFIRQDPTYANAGTGGHYEFTRQDIPTLRSRFTTWQSQKAKTAPVRKAKQTATAKKTRYRANHDTPLGVDILTPGHRLSDEERAMIAQMSRTRVDRLEARLKETGMHISQMRARNTWKAVK